MNTLDPHTVEKNHEEQLQRYYRYHSRIYDLTRWMFLFGRQKIIDHLPELPHNPVIVEVGCGTGKNLESLEYHYPDARLYGLDLSKEMIEKARERFDPHSQVSLVHHSYGKKEMPDLSADLILLSYTLTMTGDSVEEVLQQLYEDLRPGGYVAVVDFHDTPFVWFRRWMKTNHVDIDGRLPTLLKKFFTPVADKVRPAYFGLWSYIIFIGKRT